MPLSEWDALSDDDRDWAIATDRIVTCPVCGGDDPERLCQDPRFQHAWEVRIGRCYKQRAIQLAMEPYRNDPFFATFIPHASLNPARVKQ